MFTSELAPPHTSIPDLPRKLSADPKKESVLFPDLTLASKNGPPPLPPRPSKDRMPKPPSANYVKRFTEHRKHSKGLPPVAAKTQEREVIGNSFDK